MRCDRRQIRATCAALVAVLVVSLGCTACLPRDVGILASPEFNGRKTGSSGGRRARNWILSQLESITEGANPSASGDHRWLQDLGEGRANIVAIIRGTEKPDEYVAVGAHYDHLGHACRTADAADTICNGATDNGAGVAAVLAIARRFHEQPPKRSVLIALWDSEEYGYVGSKGYVAHPLVPLAKTVTYLNIDLIGSNLVPGLRNTSFGIGSETGGARLQQLLQAADDKSSLDLLPVSVIFGEGRSDHAQFVAAKVPTIFFGDGGGGCYHTAQDDVDVVDFTKLATQTELIFGLARTLANTSSPPKFVAGTPVTTFADVVQFETVVDQSWPDRDLFSPTDQATMGRVRDTVHRIVDEGADQFDDADVGEFLSGVVDDNALLKHLVCNGFLAPD
jgi:hypothetical protein